MKKVLFIVAVMLLSISTVSTAQFKFGGGVTLGTKSGIDDDFSEKMGFGVNVRGEFSLMDKLALTPGFTYFFPSAPEGVDVSLWQLNADIHYTFFGSPGPASFYGLGGLNYTSAKTEFDDGGALGDLGGFGDLFGDVLSESMEETENEIGLNIGAGVSLNKLYGEVKYDTALEQVGISVGILF